MAEPTPCSDMIEAFVSEIVSDSIFEGYSYDHRYRRRGLYRQQLVKALNDKGITDILVVDNLKTAPSL